MYARDGVELSGSTLADQVDQCSSLLRAIRLGYSRYVMAASKIHVHDMLVPLLNAGMTRPAPPDSGGAFGKAGRLVRRRCQRSRSFSPTRADEHTSVCDRYVPDSDPRPQKHFESIGRPRSRGHASERDTRIGAHATRATAVTDGSYCERKKSSPN
jgi:hypothetical protein